MQRDSLYKIRDRAIRSGRAVFSVQQLANLTGKKREVAKVYASRLVEHGMAARLNKRKIAFSDDDFVIATQFVEPSYVSLGSALAYHGVSEQVTKEVECVTTRNSIHYKGLGIRYHKIATDLFFGYERLQKGNSYVFVATPEKALIDGVYLNIYSAGDIDEYLHRGGVDIGKLRTLLGRFHGRGSKKLSKVISSSTKIN